MAKKKKKKQQAKKPTLAEKLKKWETPQPAHPVYVDLDGVLKAIDAGPGSKEAKEADKKVATYLAFMADENGEVRLDDEIVDFSEYLLR